MTIVHKKKEPLYVLEAMVLYLLTSAREKWVPTAENLLGVQAWISVTVTSAGLAQSTEAYYAAPK